MCEKILEKIPSMTAEERRRLQENCERIRTRSKDALLIAEAGRILARLSAVAQREAQFVARLSEQRRIEYAFRRLPASERERDTIRALFEEEMALAAQAAEDDNAVADWRDEIDTMCRERRHLLVPGPEAIDRAAHELDWSTCLIDTSRGSIRLKPEATAAFARLGYVAAEAIERTGSRAG